MRFVNPWLLTVIPLSLLLWAILYRFFRRRAATVLFPDFRRMRRGADGRVSLCRLFDAAAMVLIALALARPVSVERVITPPVEGKDIMIVLDISGSMEALDFQHIYMVCV